MLDFVLLEGDRVIFSPAFGPAVVTPLPGTLQGSGGATLNGKKICIDGDEKNVEVTGCSYISSAYVTPGVGTLKIESLGGDQKARKTNSRGKPVLLKGSVFTAKFEVTTPAQQPPAPPAIPNPIPDPSPQYSGTGNFVTTNSKLRGT